jgi:hypothetical protein
MPERIRLHLGGCLRKPAPNLAAPRRFPRSSPARAALFPTVCPPLASSHV